MSLRFETIQRSAISFVGAILFTAMLVAASAPSVTIV